MLELKYNAAIQNHGKYRVLEGCIMKKLQINTGLNMGTALYQNS